MKRNAVDCRIENINFSESAKSSTMSAIALAPSTITKAANALLVTTQAAAPISTLVAKMSVLGALSTMGTVSQFLI